MASQRSEKEAFLSRGMCMVRLLQKESVTVAVKAYYEWQKNHKWQRQINWRNCNWCNTYLLRMRTKQPIFKTRQNSRFSKRNKTADFQNGTK